MEADKERKAESVRAKMAEDASQAAARQEESRQKFLRMMNEGHANQAKELFQSSFTAWVRLLAELRKERQNEKSMMAIFAGNKSRLVLSEVVSVWTRLMND